MRIRRVLFATDFSRASTKAFDAAVTLAKVNRAELIILHVIAPPTMVGPEQYLASDAWRELDRQNRERAKRELAKLTAKASTARLKVKGVLAEGPAAPEIVRVGRAKKADLLVVGSHGRGGFARLLLGSVAGRVVATAHRPVVTVPSR